MSEVSERSEGRCHKQLPSLAKTSGRMGGFWIHYVTSFTTCRPRPLLSTTAQWCLLGEAQGLHRFIATLESANDLTVQCRERKRRRGSGEHCEQKPSAAGTVSTNAWDRWDKRIVTLPLSFSPFNKCCQTGNSCWHALLHIQFYANVWAPLVKIPVTVNS